MNWFVFSIAAVFALATAELTQQHLLNKKNGLSVRSSAVLTFLIQSIFSLIAILLLSLQDQLPIIFTPDILVKLLFVAFIASIGMNFYLQSFKVKNISFSGILISSSIVISTFLGIIFFNESTSFIKFLGIILVLGAIISVNFKNTSLEKNHLYGLLAGLIFGVCYTIDKSIVLDVSPIVYIFPNFLLVAFFGFLLNPKDVITSVKGRVFNDFLPIIVSAIAYFLFNFLTFTSYTFGGEVGKVDAINNSQVFLIILFEYFILKHTQSTLRKLVTAAIAITGIVILGIY